jgi:2,4-dienoyl-CoA reductase-like NADH-dependent reductase (Old Yellow Enzyme family)
MSALFSPLKLRDTEFSNRVWVSPMCQYMATDGHVGPWHSAHLGALATGAPGMIMVEATGEADAVFLARAMLHNTEG